MLAQVDECDAGQAQVFDDAGRRIREQDLTPVSRSTDAPRAMDTDADVAFLMHVRLG